MKIRGRSVPRAIFLLLLVVLIILVATTRESEPTPFEELKYSAEGFRSRIEKVWGYYSDEELVTPETTAEDLTRYIRASEIKKTPETDRRWKNTQVQCSNELPCLISSRYDEVAIQFDPELALGEAGNKSEPAAIWVNLVPVDSDVSDKTGTIVLYGNGTIATGEEAQSLDQSRSSLTIQTTNPSWLTIDDTTLLESVYGELRAIGLFFSWIMSMALISPINLFLSFFLEVPGLEIIMSLIWRYVSLPITLGYLLVPILMMLLPFILPRDLIGDDEQERKIKKSFIYLAVFWIAAGLMGGIFRRGGPLTFPWLAYMTIPFFLAYVIFSVVLLVKNKGYRLLTLGFVLLNGYFTFYYSFCMGMSIGGVWL